MRDHDRKAVLLDRDGTLIRDVGYPRDPQQVSIVPGAVKALKELGRHKFLLVVISNQSGIGRKLITVDEAERVDRQFRQLFQKQGVELDGVYYCAHSPDDGCECRKPSPGLILRAANDLSIDLPRSWMVGDKPTDLEAGRRAGCSVMQINVAQGPSAWKSILRGILAVGESDQL